MSMTGVTEDGVVYHVHAPAATGYVAQVCRRWIGVGEFADQKQAAEAMLSKFMAARSIKRGRVIARFESRKRWSHI